VKVCGEGPNENCNGENKKGGTSNGGESNAHNQRARTQKWGEVGGTEGWKLKDDSE